MSDDPGLALGEDGSLPVDLVLPDRDVLGDASRELVGEEPDTLVACIHRHGEEPADVHVVAVDRGDGRDERQGAGDADDAQPEPERLPLQPRALHGLVGAVDPFPLWEHARRESPVARIGEVVGRPAFWVTRWADVEQVSQLGKGAFRHVSHDGQAEARKP